MIPEIEALAVDALQALEDDGIEVIPTARATAVTMNRDRIRDLAPMNSVCARHGCLCHQPRGTESGAAPLVSRGGEAGDKLLRQGQSVVKCRRARLPDLTVSGARGSGERVIVEEFLHFELEITLLTIRQADGTTRHPIGHEQEGGDYQCSWQPAAMTDAQLEQAQTMARKVTENLGGVGLFDVEFFLYGDEVVFSERLLAPTRAWSPWPARA